MNVYIVITTDYATNRIIHAYGPYDRTTAENLRMSLPASSTRDHTIITLDHRRVKGEHVMGAANFNTTRKGKNIRTTFAETVKEAQYEYGHGGYTGTIAEKHEGVIEIIPPKDVDPLTFVGWIEDFAYDASKVPAKHRAQVEANQRAYEDKWGPALGVKVAGPDADGLCTFVFFGLASE